MFATQPGDLRGDLRWVQVNLAVGMAHHIGQDSGRGGVLRQHDTVRVFAESGEIQSTAPQSEQIAVRAGAQQQPPSAGVVSSARYRAGPARRAPG